MIISILVSFRIHVSYFDPISSVLTSTFLQVDHLNLGRYMNMLATGEFVDDLDTVSEINSSTGTLSLQKLHF